MHCVTAPQKRSWVTIRIQAVKANYAVIVETFSYAVMLVFISDIFVETALARVAVVRDLPWALPAKPTLLTMENSLNDPLPPVPPHNELVVKCVTWSH